MHYEGIAVIMKHDSWALSCIYVMQYVVHLFYTCLLYIVHTEYHEAVCAHTLSSF